MLPKEEYSPLEKNISSSELGMLEIHSWEFVCTKWLFSLLPPFPKMAFVRDIYEIFLPKSKFHSVVLAYFDCHGYLMQLIYYHHLLKHFLGLVFRPAAHLSGFLLLLLQFIVHFLLSTSSKSWPLDIWIFLDILLCTFSYLNELGYFAMYTLIRARTVCVCFTAQCLVHSGHSNIC